MTIGSCCEKSMIVPAFSKYFSYSSRITCTQIMIMLTREACELYIFMRNKERKLRSLS